MTFEKIVLNVVFGIPGVTGAGFVNEALVVNCKKPDAKVLYNRLQYEFMVCKIKYKTITMTEDYDAMQYTYDFA